MDGNSDKLAINVVPSGSPLGAEIKDVDVTQVNTAMFAKIQQALYNHQVILFRDQNVDIAQARYDRALVRLRDDVTGAIEMGTDRIGQPDGERSGERDFYGSFPSRCADGTAPSPSSQ